MFTSFNIKWSGFGLDEIDEEMTKYCGNQIQDYSGAMPRNLNEDEALPKILYRNSYRD